MKERTKNIGLTLLTVAGIILVLISIYGLVSGLWERAARGGQADGLQDAAADTAEAGQPAEIPDSLHQPGEDPDIDAAIYEELSRVMNETAFAYRSTDEGRRGYAGRHNATFTNRAGVDFDMLHLQVSLYQLDDPQRYQGAADIAEEPLEVHNVYVGPVGADETVDLSFLADTGAYNYFLFGYGYSLPEG